MLNVILFGPPGSGKGTQSEKLIEKYGLKHLSTGDILRQEINNKTLLGLEAKKLMEIGQLVPDEVVIGMISAAVEANKTGKGFLFDGFPRTEAQSIALDNLLATHDTSISVVLALQVSEDELVKRLLHRGLHSGRPDDNNETVINARIVEYHQKTTPVAEHYKKSGKVKMIKGEGNVDEIFEALSAELDARVGFAETVKVD